MLTQCINLLFELIMDLQLTVANPQPRDLWCCKLEMIQGLLGKEMDSVQVKLVQGRGQAQGGHLEVVGPPDLEVGHPRVPPELGVYRITPLLMR